MPNLKPYFDKVERKFKSRAANEPGRLKEKYIQRAKPSVEGDESEIFNYNKRFHASHITKGFASKAEFKDDLKALIVKPALLAFEAAYAGAKFALKLMELLAHCVVALVELLIQEPKEPKKGIEGIFEQFPFVGKKTPELKVPEKDLNNAGDVAIDMAESLVKLVVYPWIASAEFYAQSGSFIAKCLFSLDEKMEEKFSELATSAQGYMQDAAKSIASMRVG